MRVYLTVIIAIILFTLLTDLALWQVVKAVLRQRSKLRTLIKVVYWLIPASFIIFFLNMFNTASAESIDQHDYFRFTLFNGFYLAIYLPKLVALFAFSLSFLFTKRESSRLEKLKGKRINRAQFLGKMSLIVGAIPFTTIMYNISNGRFKFVINQADVPCTRLPKSFDGLRIIQLSDIHLGNFNSNHKMLKIVMEEINAIEPDLIFITGDLVNNFAAEAAGWDIIFSKMKAKLGKYAVLGNHDYGDYSDWKSPKMKTKNFEMIQKSYESFGFTLLNNRNENITIKGESISLIGVENWGHPPFPRYGDINKAMAGDLADFKILLSHDPDHWEAEILKHTDIKLTLAGHTHGMQVGLKWRNKEWSPAKWKYKYWGGLHEENRQYLYVNRGLGFIGVPLRVGMPPEVTYLTLKSKS